MFYVGIPTLASEAPPLAFNFAAWLSFYDVAKMFRHVTLILMFLCMLLIPRLLLLQRLVRLFPLTMRRLRLLLRRRRLIIITLRLICLRLRRIIMRMQVIVLCTRFLFLRFASPLVQLLHSVRGPHMPLGWGEVARRAAGAVRGCSAPAWECAGGGDPGAWPR